MNTYIYYDNSKQWHGSILFECQDCGIQEADAQFEKAIGNDPSNIHTLVARRQLSPR